MSCPNGWYAPVDLAGLETELLVDSGASKTCISEEVYNRLPAPRPELKNTNLQFQMADGTLHGATGVCHVPLTVKFGDEYRTNQVPMYVVKFMPKGMNGVLGLDSGARLGFYLGLGNGKLVRMEDIDIRASVLQCEQRSKQAMVAKASLLNNITIPAFHYKEVDVSTRNTGFSKSDGDLAYAKCLPKFYEDYGVWAVRGLTDLSKGPSRMVFVNLTEFDVVIRKGTKCVTLEPIEDCSKARKYWKWPDRTVEDEDKPMPYYFPCDPVSVMPDNVTLPRSLFKIHTEGGKQLTPKAKALLATLFSITPPQEENEESEDNMSGLEDDMEVMLPPVAEPSQVSLKPGELPQAISELLNDCRDHLSESQMTMARDLLCEMTEAFMDPSKPLIGTDAVAHYIDTGDTRPIRIPPRRIAPGRRQIIEDEITKMLEQGIIRESDSPWCSPVVLVKKKDGSTRFCIDYRQINNATRKNAYPLPRIDDNLEMLKGNSWFCTLDLASGYWQIKMSDEDRPKTAFASHLGLYEFNRMPFGLTNAPATFQYLMEKVLSGYVRTKCLLYLDDVIVFGKTFEEVYQNLKDVLARFNKYNLKLKAKKCKLFAREVDFLGHVVSEAGVKCDPKKVEKIKQLEAPTNKTGVRAVLGLGNYYRRFIKGYGNIIAPLQRLTRKEVDFEWGDEEQASLDKLKEAFCSAPILAYPDHKAGNFIVDTDASNYAIGGVLSQVQDGKERVIMYGSKCLSGPQLRWCTTRRELWAIFYFVTRCFSYYLVEQKFTLRTDHSALRWLTTMQDNTRDLALARWLSYLLPLYPNMTITYRKGEDHGNADAMSRLIFKTNTRTCPREDCPDRGHMLTKEHKKSLKASVPKVVESLNLMTPMMTRSRMRESELNSESAVVSSFTNEELRDAQHEDPELKRFIDLLAKHDEKPPAKRLSGESSDVRLLCSMWSQFKVVNKILYRLGKEPSSPWRYVMPSELRTTIMQLLHDSRWAGHPGMSRMKSTIGSRFYWPRMRGDIEAWIKCCRACAMAKRGKGRGKAPLQQEISGAPFQRVAFDVIGPLPRTDRGNRFILVVVDYYTKWAEAYELPNHTAATVADTLTTRWIATWGTPLRMHCDNAPEFRGHVLAQMRDILGVRGTFTSPYRPKANGLCERTNQTIEGILRTLISTKRDTWDKELPFALMSYRATPHSSTGFTPNMLCFGRENAMPADIMFGHSGALSPRSYQCYCDYVDNLRKVMTESYGRARHVLGVAAMRQKVYHDEDTAPRFFKVGDWVLYYHKPSSRQTLDSGWRGPYVVVKKLSAVDYLIQKDPPLEPPRTAHCDDLQMDIEPERTNWIREGLALRKLEEEKQRKIRDCQSVVLKDAQTQTDDLVIPANTQSSASKPKHPKGSTTATTGSAGNNKKPRRSQRLAQKAT